MIFSIAYWPTKATRPPALTDSIVRSATDILDSYRRP
jgi:hypothetical protein